MTERLLAFALVVGVAIAFGLVLGVIVGGLTDVVGSLS